MALGFAYAAPDYTARAQAGVPLDPNAPDQTAMPAAPAPAALPAAPQGYKPNFLDILQGMVFNGQSPAEAAMAARGRDFALQQQRYGIQRQQMLMETLKAASPDQRLAMLLNPEKLGEAVSSRFSSMLVKGGETRNNGEGAGNFTAPLVGFDEKSGKGYTSLPGLTVENGPSLGGDVSVSPLGLVNSGRTGPTGQTVSLPQIMAPGSVPNAFTPTVSGLSGPKATTAPAAPISAKPAASALVAQNGQLDPAAFFKSFVLPHEGGWNARDLNGSPTKFGINAKSNPDIDLQKLTPEGAGVVFSTKYFPQSGAAQLPPALAAVHADTSFINPAKAHEFLAASGGDPSKYMDLRDAWMSNLTQKYPAAQKYAQAWSNRNADLRAVASQLGAQGGQGASGVGTAGQGGPGAAPGFSGPPAKMPHILDPAAAEAEGFPKGAVVEVAPDGSRSVKQAPEYSPAERSKIREQFLGSEQYKQHTSASSALQALQANIGQMTGPAAYTILDTMARTINPGAVARQGTISAIEDMMGLPAKVVGGLQNLVGQGKIPLQTQQQIIDAVTPFAAAHYDQAKSLSDANAAIARAHKLDPSELVAPIGSRPQRLIVTMPPAPERKPGALYSTSKGPLIWTGQAGHEWARPQ